MPVRVLDRRREDGSNAPVVDPLQGAFGVTAFPTLVIYSPSSGQHYARMGFDGVDSTRDWTLQSTMRERINLLARHAVRKP